MRKSVTVHYVTHKASAKHRLIERVPLTQKEIQRHRKTLAFLLNPMTITAMEMMARFGL